MPPRNRRLMDISNNSRNDGNQQGKCQEPRLNQGQPLDMFQLMQTLIEVVQQQATTGDNLTRMMEQRQGQQGGMTESKRFPSNF
nr:hypothetical protein CFP56_33275 [Quercus suber]